MCHSPHALSVSTYRSLRTSGWARRELDATVRSGSLRRVRRGVYASIDACDPAVRAAHHGGALACVSAARHLGLWVLDGDETHVWLRHGGHRYVHPNCACIEHWDEGPPVDAFGLPSVPRILAQIARCRGVESFFVTLESALRKAHLTANGLEWLRSISAAPIREAIDLARSTADSGLESLLRFRLRRYGLDVQSQVPIAGVGDVDFLIDGWLVVEVDGKPGHDDIDSRHKDLVRDANAAMWGYVSLRFDYALIVHDWDLVERAILAQVARRAAHNGG